MSTASRRTVIVSAVRTPIGKLGGALSSLSAVDLGATVIRAAVERAGVAPDHIDKVVMGMVLQAGAGQIPSRQAARQAGLPWTTTSETINKVCASGMRAVTLGDQIIRAGDGEVIVSGGMESMSNAPYALPSARWGMRLGNTEVVDLLNHDGLRCAFHQVPMSVHGAKVAAEYGISREAQDAWALRSHERAIYAQESGYFKDEIIPVEITNKNGSKTIVDQDEAPRRDTSLEKLAKLKPLGESTSTITAGNAPGVNDGAAALVLMSEERAKQEGLTPLATIIGHADYAVVAPYLAVTPAFAIKNLLTKTRRETWEVDLFEVNEAFAAVPITTGYLLGWDENKVNVNGGAVAIGHPIGASGARIICTLIHELRRRGGGLGVAAICSGAAQGDAIMLEVHPPSSGEPSESLEVIE
ncbi:acetyl-CoA C-acetyltransferase [Paenibacillus sp. N1-5-1-14]|uniref:acetyl-CoA C-acetyltransferase n=1 Tax=Paenibacillus radicibacter TaxID=2972488 RepID=UPI002158FD5B|nr:acetyl-CoA C-acetyltransferase [Paenibacillus radicibacter]MCR8642044.1 acetyl-CoA C-acetyltransferase [Paenibacillus radicibacter]